MAFCNWRIISLKNNIWDFEKQAHSYTVHLFLLASLFRSSFGSSRKDSDLSQNNSCLPMTPYITEMNAVCKHEWSQFGGDLISHLMRVCTIIRQACATDRCCLSRWPERRPKHPWRSQVANRLPWRPVFHTLLHETCVLCLCLISDINTQIYCILAVTLSHLLSKYLMGIFSRSQIKFTAEFRVDN